MKEFGKNLVFIAAIMILCFCSCSKRAVEKKLEGTWKKVDITNMTSPEIINWVFSSGYNYILRFDTGASKFDTLVKRDYLLTAGLSKKTLSFPSHVDTIPDEKWIIDKLNKIELVLYRQTNGVEYLEFEKQ